MPLAPNLHSVAKNVVIDFLRKTLPFSELVESDLEELAESSVIGFFPRGTVVFQQGITDVEHLYVVQKGAVKVSVRGEDDVESLMDFRGEGSYFGAIDIISGAKAQINVETLEDTFRFVIGKEAFLGVISKNPSFATHYVQKLSENLVRSAYSDLRSRKLECRTDESFFLFSARVGDVIKRPAEVIARTESCHKVAERMASLGIGSLLVRDAEGSIVGIVTDKDLRNKVIARRQDYQLPVVHVMSSPVRTIPRDAPCFEAVLKMMTEQVHHLAVEHDQQIVGVVTAHDILIFQGSSPVGFLREIRSQKKIEGLYPLAGKIASVVRSLLEGGAKANNVTRTIAILNDHIVERLLTLLEEQHGTPPVPYSWMMMGSEGRQEQTFHTDQDNAIIYDDPGVIWESVKGAKLYFRRFGNDAIKHLHACGYPLCKGGMMASNSRWRKSYPVWVGYFDHWMSSRDPLETLHAKIFFDFRSGHGSPEPAIRLRDYLADQAQSGKLFLEHLIRDCLSMDPPLSFFRNFVVEKDGEHKNRLDLKLRGLVPFVDFARMMALKHGVKETNTVERLKVLNREGHIPDELHKEIGEAYEFIMHLRLVQQLSLIEDGQEPHSFVDPADLSELEKKTLKEAFGVIKRIHNFLVEKRDEY